jgi:hypothetical protein
MINCHPFRQSQPLGAPKPCEGGSTSNHLKKRSKKVKKKVDFPLLLWDIVITHGNNRTKTQE